MMVETGFKPIFVHVQRLRCCLFVPAGEKFCPSVMVLLLWMASLGARHSLRQLISKLVPPCVFTALQEAERTQMR
jgi:hypothetical protein